MPLTFDEVSKIVSIIDSSSCDELVVETDDIKLVVRRRSSARAASGGANDSLPAADSTAGNPIRSASGAGMAEIVHGPGRKQAEPRVAGGTGRVEIASPMVGTFYTSPAPGKPAFVTEGSIIAAGDPLCIIEVMKLFTTIFASTAGRIECIFPENGELVEHGQILFAVAPV
jgi:acetyl-CoA carboxylase biotin carboxyl carrier protein